MYNVCLLMGKQTFLKYIINIYILHVCIYAFSLQDIHLCAECFTAPLYSSTAAYHLAIAASILLSRYFAPAFMLLVHYFHFVQLCSKW